MKKKLPFTYSLFIALGIFSLNFRSGTPPIGLTGAPGEGLCTNCHSNPGTHTGTVEITGVPTTITPNTPYTLTVTIGTDDDAPTRAGFQMVALDGNMSNSPSAGTFSLNGSNVQIASNATREYAEHQGALFFPDPASSISYTVDWTSPASITNDINFYAVGNAGGGSTGNSGDIIVTTTVSTSAALPVELVAFDIKNLGAQELSITWETATETNSSHFEVLRSMDGVDYEVIDVVPAAGFSTSSIQYSYMDKKPILNKTSFYRLKQIDNNEKGYYSEIKAIEILDFEEDFLTIYPNPLPPGESLFLEYLSKSEYPNVVANVYDVHGKPVILAATILDKGLVEGFNKFIIETSVLTPGIYFLVLADDQKVYGRQSFVVN